MLGGKNFPKVNLIRGLHPVPHILVHFVGSRIILKLWKHSKRALKKKNQTLVDLNDRML